ncbi:DUF2339 domain-containing protein [Chitinophaga caseinilytica]|uniref:DUF2339 domain-containing protein n=1 Tax=Chitinophaga caseinilytica TaxID=2267521 RepID=UPI003C2E7CB8
MSITLVILLLIVLLVLVVMAQNRNAERMSEILYRLDKLSKELEKREISPAPGRPASPEISPDSGTVVEAPIAPEPVAPPAPVPLHQEPPVPQFVEEVPEPEEKEEMRAAFQAAEMKRGPEAIYVEPEPQPSFWEKFMEKNPDIEKFIGENLFNKIGIAVLVIGIGFFLKFAIDKNWINEIGRTFIGFLCGAALIGLAHRMRKSFAAFSSVLVGGGVAVLYFTVAIAFHQYALVGQTTAFLLTVAITAFTVFLSISYDRKELAVLAILGGFGAPFMVSTGHANLIAFFSWMLILNVGMLVLAYFKKWNLVNIICYALTWLIFGGWMGSGALEGDRIVLGDVRTAFVFATAFYVVFFLMNVINNVRNGTRFRALEIGILLSNTLFYYSAGMLFMEKCGWQDWQGLFTALMAVFNCVFAYFLFRNSKADRTMVYLLIGLVLTFMSLAAPVQLNGNYITLFWAAESVLIFWLFRKSGIVQMKYASMAVLVLMLISLMMDWSQLYFPGPELRPVINKAFVTGIAAIAAVYLLRRQVAQDEPSVPLFPVMSAGGVSRVLQTIFVILIYVVFLLEIVHQVNSHQPSLTALATGCFNFGYLSVLLLLARRRNDKGAVVLMFLSLFAALAMLGYFNLSVIRVRTEVLAGETPMWVFLFHYLQTGLLVWLLVEMKKTIPQFRIPQLETGFNWFLSFMALYLLSAELDHLVVVLRAPVSAAATLGTVHGTGYALLWGLFAFVLMFIGLRRKSRDLRIVAITVFGITLVKLFAFDLRGLGEGGKIAAFISLGILLLLISFMYQRLKKIILTDDQPVEEKLPD